MKRNTMIVASLSSFFVAHLSAQPIEPNSLASPLINEESNFSPRDIAFALAPIKSQATLRAYQLITPEVVSPLGKLSTKAKAEFLASVTFNENGLTGFNYKLLENELTSSQVHNVLALFGAQHITQRLTAARIDTDADRIIMKSLAKDFRQDPELEDDHPGFSCVGRATCMKSTDMICMSGC